MLHPGFWKIHPKGHPVCSVGVGEGGEIVLVGVEVGGSGGTSLIDEEDSVIVAKGVYVG